MTRYLSSLIAWGCTLWLVLLPLAGAYLLVDINAFADLVQRNMTLPIQWQSVSEAQWYGLWTLTMAYLVVGLLAVYFLRRAFRGFAQGDLFDLKNSRSLRQFSTLLFVQALAGPIHRALSSVLLSWNHPAGQKLLSITFGSNELAVAVLAMILWVMSDLLVEASRLQSENQQFV